jgi:hypothetical protein
VQLALAYIHLYIYGQQEEVVSGHGLHLWDLDLYQVSVGIEMLGDFLEWIWEILEVFNVFKIVLKESFYIFQIRCLAKIKKGEFPHLFHFLVPYHLLLQQISCSLNKLETASS